MHRCSNLRNHDGGIYKYLEQSLTFILYSYERLTNLHPRTVIKIYLICILLIFFSVSFYSTQLDDSVLTSESTDGIDRDLSVVNADSESTLKLDAKITHEAANGSGENLETIFQIEYELMANASSDRQLLRTYFGDFRNVWNQI